MAVALLGLLTAALSADALYRAISVTRAQRLERGREAVRDEIDRLAALGPAGIASTFSTVVGLRGGLATGATAPAQIAAAVPATWREAMRTTATRAAGSALPAENESEIDGGQLVARVAPGAGRRAALGRRSGAAVAHVAELAAAGGRARLFGAAAGRQRRVFARLGEARRLRAAGGAGRAGGRSDGSGSPIRDPGAGRHRRRDRDAGAPARGGAADPGADGARPGAAGTAGRARAGGGRRRPRGAEPAGLDQAAARPGGRGASRCRPRRARPSTTPRRRSRGSIGWWRTF